jgi:hypothetical protein
MYDMNDSLRRDVLAEIERQYGGKERGTYINQIECPTCGKKEAFTSFGNPWVIKCGRANNCGEHHHVKELFPHLFETWTERYQPKTEPERIANPTAVADGYLRDGRGFDLAKVKGWYTQEWYQNHDINEGSTTVRFPMANGFWERVLDKPERFGKLKARAVGNYKGLVWQPPIFTDAELAEADQIFITEGIFDAISWMHAGRVAVSNISSANFPSDLLERIKKACPATKKLPVIVWAQDGDKAGQDATLKHVERADRMGFTSAAAQPRSSKHDWNDLHQLGRMTDKDIEEYLHQGDLLLAKSPGEKALLMWHKRERRSFWFTFGTRLYWWELNMDAYDREVRRDGDVLTDEDRDSALANAGVVSCIATAIPRPLYFQANKVTDESWYYFRIETADGVHKAPFTPKQLTGASEFKNRLLAIKNAWYTGSGKQLDQLMQDMMYNLKTVETTDFIGYSKEHKAWIFNEVAIRDGRARKINSEDYFEFGKLSVKSLASEPRIDPNLNMREYDRSWPQHVVGAFGTAGTITTAFFLGSLFAEQIRQLTKSYPFFELVGQAGAGKSTLIEFLWKCLGREDYEGFDPQKATVAARARMFSQVSNLPVVLIESDREATDSAKAKQFDWDDLKTAYNGRAMRSRGVKNGGNETYDPPFRGSIVISQNDQVAASEAILSRIVHISVTREHQTLETKRHAEWLERAPMATVSGFLTQATMAETALMTLFESRAPVHEQALLGNGTIRMIRIAKNHGQMMALVECLGPMCLNLIHKDQVAAALTDLAQMAAVRQQAINADHPVVQEFWEAVDYIESCKGDPVLNHYGTGDTGFAINLKEFEHWCGEFKLRMPEQRILKQHLKSSKVRKFSKTNHPVRSKICTDKTVKCWIFEANK